MGESSTQVEVFNIIEPNIKWAILREISNVTESETERVNDSNAGSLQSSSILTKPNRRKNSDQEQKKKSTDKLQLQKKVSQSNEKSVLYDEEEDKDFNLPLTKENLEIMQKKYEQTN